MDLHFRSTLGAVARYVIWPRVRLGQQCIHNCVRACENTCTVFRGFPMPSLHAFQTIANGSIAFSMSVGSKLTARGRLDFGGLLKTRTVGLGEVVYLRLLIGDPRQKSSKKYSTSAGVSRASSGPDVLDRLIGCI